MATTHFVSVEQYLHSTFEVDAEYVGGRIVPRTMPKKTHSKMQRYLLRVLADFGRGRGYEVWPEQRVRTKVDPPSFRVPDVCVTRGEPDEEVFTHPPFLCIEILSEEDSRVELRSKIDEYLAFGVEYVWVVDPFTRLGEIYTPGLKRTVGDRVFRAGDIAVDLNEM